MFNRALSNETSVDSKKSDCRPPGSVDSPSDFPSIRDQSDSRPFRRYWIRPPRNLWTEHDVLYHFVGELPPRAMSQLDFNHQNLVDQSLSEYPSNSFHAEDLPADTESAPLDLTDQYGLIDLSRISPRIVIKESSARVAFRREILGILAIDSKGMPIGQLVSKTSVELKGNRILHSAVVTKIKPG